jgi:hypothetical protein
MMTLNKAKGLALDGLARLTGRPSRELRLVDEQTQCRRAGWVFFGESPAFTGLVMVTHTGEVHPLAGERPLDEGVCDFERMRRRRDEGATTLPARSSR